MSEHELPEGAAQYYFPPPGSRITNQDRRTAEAVGLAPGVVEEMNRFVEENPFSQRRASTRWALWRDGYLVHVEGDFNATVDVASLRKTWHAMIVGAALLQGRIPSLDQKLGVWQTELEGNHALATWRDVMTQSAGFDYPYGEYPAFRPGEMWTYSDLNLVHLCHALAKVYGKKDFYDEYAEVAREAYFDAIGMRGWGTRITFDRSSGMDDGVRFKLSLEHMGRLGLLALARGSWDGKERVPRGFVEALESKQTYGMRVNYEGPNDGRVGLKEEVFPECPYGYLTWVNTDGDLYPGADSGWANGRGAGGSIVLWNPANGIVFAGVGINPSSKSGSIPLILERAVAGPNPLRATKPVPRVGRWDCFEVRVEHRASYANPFEDVELRTSFYGPDGERVDFRGFYDGGAVWKARFMPDRPGQWRYEAVFSDGSGRFEGTFLCVGSEIPGLISADAENPIWFGFRGGKRALVRSFHVGDRFFARGKNMVTGEAWDESRREAFVNWLQAQGYTMLSVASHTLNRNSEGRGAGWETPDLWDTQAPNPAAYRQMERVLEDLSRRGILVYPFAGFFGRDSDFPEDHGKQALYVNYTVARLAAYWNLLFVVGGPEPRLRRRAYLSVEDVHRLGRLIAASDVFGHLLAVHNPTGDDAFNGAPWASYGILQGPKTTDRARLSEVLLRNHHPSRPLFAQETLWAGNDHGHPEYTLEDVRKNAFVMLMSGAAINFGDMDGDSSSGFSGSLDLEQRVQARHDAIRAVWDFFEGIPFYTMRPRQDLVDCGYCLTDPGTAYLVYLECGGTVNVKVEEGAYRIRWVDAQDTSDVRDGGTTEDGRGLTSPEEGDDWLLYLTRA